MDRLHEAVNSRLPSCGPLRVMLAYDRRAIPENVGHVLARRALP
jgi:hypothetical protein